MDPKATQKMMFEGMRTAMRMNFDTMNAIQEQMEKTWKMFLEQSGDAQKEAEKTLDEWLENLRKGRDEFRRNMEDGIHKMEDLLGQEETKGRMAMQDYTAMWGDMWKQWTGMQADIYRGWMEAWTRGMGTGVGAEEELWPEAKDLYQRWLGYLQEMVSKFSVPTEGVGPETFTKLFQSADVYTKLYSMWMD